MTEMATTTVAAVQATPVFLDREATTNKAVSLISAVDTWYDARPLAEVLINGQCNPRLLAELAKGGARVRGAPWPRR
jgi:hypothetical protein